MTCDSSTCSFDFASRLVSAWTMALLNLARWLRTSPDTHEVKRNWPSGRTAFPLTTLAAIFVMNVLCEGVRVWWLVEEGKGRQGVGCVGSRRKISEREGFEEGRLLEGAAGVLGRPVGREAGRKKWGSGRRAVRQQAQRESTAMDWRPLGPRWKSAGQSEGRGGREEEQMADKRRQGTPPVSPW